MSKRKQTDSGTAVKGYWNENVFGPGPAGLRARVEAKLAESKARRAERLVQQELDAARGLQAALKRLAEATEDHETRFAYREVRRRLRVMLARDL